MTIYSGVYFIPRYNIHWNVIPGNAKLYRETNTPFVIVIFVFRELGGVVLCFFLVVVFGCGIFFFFLMLWKMFHLQGLFPI